jgi:hypothetical protein
MVNNKKNKVNPFNLLTNMHRNLTKHLTGSPEACLNSELSGLLILVWLIAWSPFNNYISVLLYAWIKDPRLLPNANLSMITFIALTIEVIGCIFYTNKANKSNNK